MTDYKETYEELKKNINEDNSKIIAFLILGVLAGRVYEKLQRVKKNVLKPKDFINLSVCGLPTNINGCKYAIGFQTF